MSMFNPPNRRARGGALPGRGPTSRAKGGLAPAGRGGGASPRGSRNTSVTAEPAAAIVLLPSPRNSVGASLRLGPVTNRRGNTRTYAPDGRTSAATVTTTSGPFGPFHAAVTEGGSPPRTLAAWAGSHGAGGDRGVG